MHKEVLMGGGAVALRGQGDEVSLVGIWCKLMAFEKVG